MNGVASFAALLAAAPAWCVAALALALDWALGEPRRWHPLVGFGHCAQALERWLCVSAGADGAQSAASGRLRGVVAAALAVLPPVALCGLLCRVSLLGPALAVAVLYAVVGHRSLCDHARAVREALDRGDLTEGRRRVGLMVSRDTADMSAARVAGAAAESVLENGNDALFGALFWFFVAGAPGALLYRLVNTLDAMWGYRTPRYLYFGWAAARLDDLLNLIPARLTAASYALTGSLRMALRCWRAQGVRWESPNAGPVMAAGAGALGLKLGGGAFYHGEWHERPALGEGREPAAVDITRAVRLVQRSLLAWIAVAGVGALLAGGCELFQWRLSQQSQRIHEALARTGVLTRLFESPASVRFGLPGSEPEWQRLATALHALPGETRA
jgi:adenosylcobinamide-phosphate synthase